MATHRIVQSYRNAGESIDASLSVVGDLEINADLVLAPEAPEAADVAIDPLVLDVSAMRACCFHCTGDCVIETNSTSSPGATITLAAGESRIARTAAECLTLLAVDVTKIYLSSTAGGTFKFMAVVDATP